MIAPFQLYGPALSIKHCFLILGAPPRVPSTKPLETGCFLGCLLYLSFYQFSKGHGQARAVVEALDQPYSRTRKEVKYERETVNGHKAYHHGFDA